MEIQHHIRQIKDFPRQGINFFDISPLLLNPDAFKQAVDGLTNIVKKLAPDLILGVESRGFLIAPPLALALNCGLGMIRKQGRLPGKTLSHRYTLEYGEDIVEIQPDMVPEGARVLIVDDLVATGGTIEAAFSLLAQTTASVVGVACLIELNDLGARERLNCPFFSLLSCPAE